MQVHEDLATLFSRNLNLSNNDYVGPVQQQEQLPQAPQAEEPVFYISQHYTHTAHVAPQQPSRSVSTPPTDQQTVEIILSRHGVDVSTLFPSQIDLFKHAEPSQQMRLVELWRICPPNYGGHALAHDLGNWPQTSLQQEETMAKLRYDRQVEEERAAQLHAQSQQNMSNGEQHATITPIQGGDGRWGGVQAEHNDMTEPYMMSGYEALAARDYNMQAKQQTFDAVDHWKKDAYSHFGTAVGGPQYNRATDPVYKSVEHLHKYPNDVSRQEQMENQ